MQPLSIRLVLIAVLGTGQTLVDGVKTGGGYSGWCAAKAEGTVGLVLNTRVAKGAVSFADEAVKFADRRVDGAFNSSFVKVGRNLYTNQLVPVTIQVVSVPKQIALFCWVLPGRVINTAGDMAMVPVQTTP